jgi:hypothetical protein
MRKPRKMPKYDNEATRALYNQKLQAKRSKAQRKSKKVPRPKRQRGILGEKAGYDKL